MPRPKKIESESTTTTNTDKVTDKNENNSTNKWSRRRRLEFIDFRLSVEGRINRADLVDYFGISVPQASLDLAVYKDLARKAKPSRTNFAYDMRQKMYLRTEDFSPLYPDECNTRKFFTDLLLISQDALSASRNFFGFTPNVSMASLPIPTRVVKDKVLSHILESMRNRLALHIVYKSLTSAKPVDYLIAPHSFAYDGYRWHTRAYCYDTHSFKDYVLSRITKTDAPRIKAPTDRFPDPVGNGFREVGTGAEDDKDWSEKVILELEPNPQLPEETRRTIELDYGLTHKGTLMYAVNKALLFYALHSLMLGPEFDVLPPECRQLTLVNRDKILALLEEVKHD